MDAKTLLLKEKLELCLKEAAALATANQQIEQGDRIPHFDEIEQPAHQLGKRLRSLIQTECTREVATKGLNDAPCPSCGRKCRVATKVREVSSIDGAMELTETVAKCRRCRRSFCCSSTLRWWTHSHAGT